MPLRHYLGYAFPLEDRYYCKLMDVDLECIADTIEDGKRQLADLLAQKIKQRQRAGELIPESFLHKHYPHPLKPGEEKFLIAFDLGSVEPMQLVVDNCQRLFLEASIMFEMGSLATSVALAVLCVEECGKFEIWWSSRDSENPFRRLHHQQKQFPVADAFRNLLWVEAIDKEILLFQTYCLREGLASLKEEFDKLSLNEKRSYINHQMFKDEPSRDKLIRLHAGPDEPAVDFDFNVKSKAILALREKALYVDIDQSGSVVASPFDITLDEAHI